jgi:uncharacterized membrane protein (DUF373 family)
MIRPDSPPSPEEIAVLMQQMAAARARWNIMTFYERFEHVIILILTMLIAVIAISATWNLAVKVVELFRDNMFDPTDYEVFQSVFGMIFTVIIALEFKRSLLVVGERRFGIVQVRAVILIAMLAIVRKLIILDLAHTEPMQLFALAAAVLSLGAVYWLVREQDRRDHTAPDRPAAAPSKATRSR